MHMSDKMIKIMTSLDIIDILLKYLKLLI